MDVAPTIAFSVRSFLLASNGCSFSIRSRRGFPLASGVFSLLGGCFMRRLLCLRSCSPLAQATVSLRLSTKRFVSACTLVPSSS